MHGFKEQDDQMGGILNLEKNLPCSGDNNKQYHSRTIDIRPEKSKTSIFNEIHLGGPVAQEKHQK